MLDFAQTEINVIETGLLPVSGKVTPGLANHLRRHVDANSPTAWPDFSPCYKDIKTAAAAEVEDDFAGLKGRERSRIAARQSHTGAIGERLQLFESITKLAGEFGVILR